MALLSFLAGIIELAKVISGEMSTLNSDLGVLLFGCYLAANGISIISLWSSPKSRLVHGARWLLSLFTIFIWTFALGNAFDYLSQPHVPGCGLSGLAAIFYCVFGSFFLTVELATWLGWWLVRKKHDVETEG